MFLIFDHFRPNVFDNYTLQHQQRSPLELLGKVLHQRLGDSVSVLWPKGSNHLHHPKYNLKLDDRSLRARCDVINSITVSISSCQFNLPKGPNVLNVKLFELILYHPVSKV